MGLLDAVKGIFGQPGEEIRTDKVYIVDANSIEQDNQKQMSPHQQIGVLKKLADFAKKESISIQALLDGKPLRVVADGDDFSGITVFFTRDKLSMDDLIRKRLKAVRAEKITVISPNQKLEEDVEPAGAQLMSTSTFRKAIGVDRRQKGGGSNRRRRSKPSSNRGRGGRPPRSSGGPQKSAGGKSDDDRVSDLIDLVD